MHTVTAPTPGVMHPRGGCSKQLPGCANCSYMFSLKWLVAASRATLRKGRDRCEVEVPNFHDRYQQIHTRAVHEELCTNSYMGRAERETNHGAIKIGRTAGHISWKAAACNTGSGLAHTTCRAIDIHDSARNRVAEHHQHPLLHVA